MDNLAAREVDQIGGGLEQRTGMKDHQGGRTATGKEKVKSHKHVFPSEEGPREAGRIDTSSYSY